MDNKFTSFSFKNRLKSMFSVDFRRLFISPIYYILIGISFVIPILVLVMTTLMVGTTSTDPVTGEITVMEPIFTNAWQIIGSLPSNTKEMTLDIATMCNIDMMYFMIAVFVCLFVSEEYRCGYCKNLFTVRGNKIDYVISKTITCFVAGGTILLSFLIGSLIGGKIAGLPFDFNGFNPLNVIMCILSRLLLVLIFVPIYLLMSVIGKHRTWLSMILSFCISMLLFMMVSSISPINSSIVNVIISLILGTLLSFLLGLISNTILKKTSII